MKRFVVAALMMCSAMGALAQYDRIQYPPALQNSYFGVNIGYINYPFTSAQLQPGRSVEQVHVPHTAVRITLLGHQFNKNVSAQVTYMRPVEWVQYNNVDGDHQRHTVWMNVAGLTVAGNWPLAKKISLFTEAGLGLIMRKGFEINNEAVVENASYATGLFGGALQYHLKNKWDLQLSAVWSPANKTVQQPHTLFLSAGFNYYMRKLPAARLEKVKSAGYHFPRQMLMSGFTTNAIGYGVNRAVSKGPIPIFWGGEVRMKTGLTLSYQRNLFHTRKVFALDWGTSLSCWNTSLEHKKIVTLSAYPVMRFTVARSATADLYLEYTVAGPTYISATTVDGHNTGEHFTFYDMMGMGLVTGKKKNLNASIRIAHFSNGNLFPHNDGFMVPLTFGFGYIWP